MQLTESEQALQWLTSIATTKPKTRASLDLFKTLAALDTKKPLSNIEAEIRKALSSCDIQPPCNSMEWSLDFLAAIVWGSRLLAESLSDQE